MTMHNYIAKNLILPIADLYLDTSVMKKLYFLEKSQWWNPKDIESFQNKKMRQLICHAYNNVPYYHDLFRSLSLTPNDIKTKEDLKKLPILNKEDIRRNPNLFLAKNIKKSTMIKVATSGSSGKPFEYMMDNTVVSISRAMGLRGWGFTGYNLGDKIVTIAGSALLPEKLSHLDTLIFKMHRNLPFSSYNMDNDKVKLYVQQILKFKPKYIRGYPSSISIIADYFYRNEIKYNHLSAIMTTAETLSKIQRKKISDAFDCDIFDQCGCNDGGEYLCECSEHVGYHIGSERSLHEFVNEYGESVSDNEVGNIILTDLWNYSMPMIRYNSGDLAIYTEELCPCGRGLPIVKSIVGRTADQIVLPDGNLLPGLTFTDILDNSGKYGNAHKIEDYQIIQEKINKFTIYLVINENYSDKTNSEILNFFEGHMGVPLKVDFKFVDQIPKTKANKRKLVISKVLK